MEPEHLIAGLERDGTARLEIFILAAARLRNVFNDEWSRLDSVRIGIFLIVEP